MILDIFIILFCAFSTVLFGIVRVKYGAELDEHQNIILAIVLLFLLFTTVLGILELFGGIK